MGNAAPCKFEINEGALVDITVEHRCSKEDEETKWAYADGPLKGTIAGLLTDQEWTGWGKLPKQFKSEVFEYRLTLQCAGQQDYIINVSEHVVEYVQGPEDEKLVSKTKYRAVQLDKKNFSTELWETLETEKKDHQKGRIEL